MISSRKAMAVSEANAQGLYEPTADEMARMKRVMLMMYRDAARVCRENGLTLMLGGGSALGAVRHGGYIPWDDDLDLMMPRADYEAFKRVFPQALGEKYVLQAPNTPGCEISNTFMKIILRGTERLELQKLNAPGAHGLWLDVFPIDNAPASAAARAVRGFFIDALNYLAVSNYLRAFDSAALREYISATPAAKRNYRLRMALGALTAFLPYRTLYNLFDRAAQMKKNTGWITVPTGIRHYAGEAHRASAYFPPSEWKFEGETVLLPGDAHEYLSQLYGPDYMTPPPENRRERHYYVALDLGAYGNEADDEKR